MRKNITTTAYGKVMHEGTAKAKGNGKNVKGTKAKPSVT
jgi:hypothetical protein